MKLSILTLGTMDKSIQKVYQWRFPMNLLQNSQNHQQQRATFQFLKTNLENNY